MRSLPFEDQWALVLQHPNERVRRIAERASHEPKLCELFPYWSVNNLHFSATSKYPLAPDLAVIGPRLQAAPRLIFFTGSGMRGLTSAEMQMIQSNPALHSKTIFVFGGM